MNIESIRYIRGPIPGQIILSISIQKHQKQILDTILSGWLSPGLSGHILRP